MPTTHQHILVPVDFSNNAMLALEEAVELARQYQADVDVIYVIPQAIFQPDWSADIEDAIDIEDIADEAKVALADLVQPHRQEGISITEHILTGGPYIEIVRMANRIRADLIVMGAHGESSTKSVLMGSVAEMVIRQAPCSVLTVREPASAPA